MKPGQVAVLSLAVGCALLAAGGVLLLGGVGQEITPAPPLERPDWVPAAALEGEEFALPPQETYAEVTARPLFNEDRLPAPPDSDSQIEDGDGTDGEEVPVELNVTVTGIIITPEKKVAMVLDNVTQQQLRLTEGMPLEGEQSSWTLASIEARRLVFDGGGEPQAIELETYTQALKGGSPARARATPVVTQTKEKAKADGAADAASATQDDRAARAEEIRRRVAERRAQLREEAERRREEQQQENDNE